MVSGTFGRKIIAFSIFISFLLVIAMVVAKIDRVIYVSRQYSATNPDLDLAVVDGIKQADVSKTQLPTQTKAVVVPHHLVAAKAIALGVKTIAQSRPKLVVILSPDHFYKCPTLLCTSRGKFDSFFGQSTIADNEVRTLLTHNGLVSDSALFYGEHGVFSLVPFIKHYLPDAKIIPIAVSQTGRGSEETRGRLLSILSSFGKRDDVSFIVSSDFSHYLPLKESKQWDEKTRSSFCGDNADEVLSLDNPRQSDCPLCLWAIKETAKSNSFWHPVELWHSNSADILKVPNAKETTSHFTFALTSKPTIRSCALDAKPGSSLLFVGDMFFDRSIREAMEKKGSDFVLSCIDPLLNKAAFVVGNLEGPITENQSLSVDTEVGSRENYVFTFPTSVASLLKRHNISIVNLGNNHISNFGLSGITSTQEKLSAQGVHYFGGLGDDAPIYREKVGETTVSFLSYNQFGHQNPNILASKIKSEKTLGNLVIVYTHWGNEYSEDVTELRELATLFAESGASAVIGSHPHIVLAKEKIGNAWVYYSLGNFLFDQYFDDRVKTGLTVFFSVTGGQLSNPIELPVVQKTNSTVCPL